MIKDAFLSGFVFHGFLLCLLLENYVIALMDLALFVLFQVFARKEKEIFKIESNIEYLKEIIKEQEEQENESA